MSVEVITNGLVVTTTTSYTSGSTSIVVHTPVSYPLTIPSVTSGQYMRCIWEAEIIWITANSGTGNVNWTISRGQEGSAAASHASGTQIFQIATIAGIAQTVFDGIQARIYTATWTSQTSVTVTHNLNNSTPFYQVYDSSGNAVSILSAVATSANVLTISFGFSFSGSIIVLG